MSKPIYRIANFLKLVIEALWNRITPRQISLHWGGHHESHWDQVLEPGIKKFIGVYALDPSPPVMFAVNDQIVSDYVHRHSFHDRAIVKLRNATFDPHSGDVFVGSRFIRESQAHRMEPGIRKSLRTRSFGDQPIIGVTQQTHYHWLIETLPRVIRAAEFEPKAVIIAPTGLSPVQRSAIETLCREIVYTDDRCKSNNLVLATTSEDSGWAHPRDLELLRKVFHIPDRIGSRQIFVTRVHSRRADATSREVERFAQNTGWMVVRAETLSWQEHLDIFGDARVIAGEHGAGLSNLALAPKGSFLTEILRRDCANPCYAALSMAINGDSTHYRSIELKNFRLMRT